MQIGDAEIILGVSFDFRYESEDACGSDSEEFMVGSKEDNSLSSDDQENFFLVPLDDKE